MSTHGDALQALAAGSEAERGVGMLLEEAGRLVVEMEGLDVPEMGVHGYPEIQGPATLVHAMGASMPKTPSMAMAPERSR